MKTPNENSQLTAEATEETAVLFDREFLTVYHTPGKDYLTFVWKGLINIKDYKEASDIYVNFFRERGIPKFLADTELMLPMNSEAQEYNGAVVMPALGRAGVRKAAIVVPESAFSALTVKRALDKCTNIEIHYFSTFEAAQRWLERTKV